MDDLGNKISAIEASGLFDRAWYLKQYPDVAMLGMDPVEHYLLVGALLHRDPGPLFSTNVYLERYGTVLKEYDNPLLHYIANKDTIEHSRFRRLAIFAAYDKDGKVDDYVVYYLTKLLEVVDKIIFISDNSADAAEIEKIRPLVVHSVFARHGEYDFGSYKAGVCYAQEAGLLERYDELVLCNDSCFGPLGSFKPVFLEMGSRGCDFWGLTQNTQFIQHLQSYFFCFTRPVFTSPAFHDFFLGVTRKQTVQDVIRDYEVRLTKVLSDAGFTWDSFVPGGHVQAFPQFKKENVTVYINYLMDLGCPLVKVKALSMPDCNHESNLEEALNKIRGLDPVLGDIIERHEEVNQFRATKSVGFSVIVPTYNRSQMVIRAVRSVLAQFHQNFEVIVVDDCSTDTTECDFRLAFAEPLATGKVRYLRLAKNVGVCNARNVGIKAANHEWIAYLDSDNAYLPTCLLTFAHFILKNPTKKLFYARFDKAHLVPKMNEGFSLDTLRRENYIDLNCFVHHIDMATRHGGFDIALRRLVDWDIILRYCSIEKPMFLPYTVVEYNDDKNMERITNIESLDDARIYVRLKHGMPFKVSTIIPTYNQATYIEQCLDSAIHQQGDFLHEIVICDDGSTDANPLIIDRYRRKYPDLIKVVSNWHNAGISTSFKRCIDGASGDFIAVLEGDDYWCDDFKLKKMVDFLKTNSDCSLVFNMIRLLNMETGASRTLKRQENLFSSRLSGWDFLANPYQNLIVNFSSCVFKAGIMKSLPKDLYRYRISEIALAFWFERFGSLGFLPEVLSVYRQHKKGVWSGANNMIQQKSALAVRLIARQLARDVYRQDFDAVIRTLWGKLCSNDNSQPLDVDRFLDLFERELAANHPNASAYPRKVHGSLCRGRTFEQPFTPDASALAAVGIQVGTYRRRNHGSCRLDILDAAGQCLGTSIQPIEDMTDNAMVLFSFDALPMRQGLPYVLRLTADEATPDNAITWWAEHRSDPDDRLSRVDGKTVDTVFMYRIFYA